VSGLKILLPDDPHPTVESLPEHGPKRPEQHAWFGGPDGECEYLGAALDDHPDASPVVTVHFVNGDRARAVRAALARGELPAE
jgi:hypothetical protein